MDERIEAAIQRVLQNHHCPSPSTHCSVLSNSPRTPFTLRPPSRQVGQPLTEINSVQDDKDRRLDCNDLRCQIDAALQSGNDSDMLVFLQIPREDILEAIKSMQRHLEQKGLGVSDVGPHESDGALDHEFIENGIDSLRRMSKSNTSLPSWTITRFVHFLSKDGGGRTKSTIGSKLTVATGSGLVSSQMFMKGRGMVERSP